MSRTAKKSLVWAAITACVAVIVVWSFRPVKYQPYAYERISDNYKRDAVKSYEVFELDSKGYVFMLVRLKTGEEFPMFCQSTSAGITPIPQSVHVEAKPDSWKIMCEPGFALTLFELSKKDETLCLGANRLVRSARPPSLL